MERQKDVNAGTASPIVIGNDYDDDDDNGGGGGGRGGRKKEKKYDGGGGGGNGDLPHSISSFDIDLPTEEERATLRIVSDNIPWAAFLVAMIELCERFTYYGLSGPFQNYIQNPYKNKGVPGAIGK